MGAEGLCASAFLLFKKKKKLQHHQLHPKSERFIRDHVLKERLCIPVFREGPEWLLLQK